MNKPNKFSHARFEFESKVEEALQDYISRCSGMGIPHEAALRNMYPEACGTWFRVEFRPLPPSPDYADWDIPEEASLGGSKELDSFMHEPEWEDV